MLPSHALHNTPQSTRNQLKTYHKKQKRQYKGITLKEYFQLCEQSVSNSPSQSIRCDDTPNNIPQNTKGILYPSNQQHRLLLERTSNSKQVKLQQPSTNKYTIKTILRQRPFNKVNISLEQARALSMRKQEQSIIKYTRSITLRSTLFPMHVTPKLRRQYYLVGQERKQILQKLKRQRENLKMVRSNELLLVTRYNTRKGMICKTLGNN